jgi:hypothetical protein
VDLPEASFQPVQVSRLRASLKMSLGGAEADQAAGDADEGFVDVSASFVADAESPVLV